MSLQRRGSVAAVVALAVAGLGLPTAALAAGGTPDVQITEIEYNTSEFVELTNVGDAPLSFAGWSFDDDSRTPGGFDLSGFGTVSPGESVIIAEDSAAYFRADWGLLRSVKVLGGNSDNLGNGDEVNIFDASGALVDRLTYPGDKAMASVSGHVAGSAGLVATNLPAGWSAAGTPWALSGTGDSEGSWTSFSGGTGSPGASTLGTSAPSQVRDPQPAPPPAQDCEPEAASGSGPATPGAVVWPGSPSVSVVDNECAWTTATGPEGRDMSGLVFDASDPGVLWAVKNKSWIFRLVQTADGVWVPDTANGWGNGKQIFFPGTTGQPDSEGITQGPDGTLYTTTERDNLTNNVALNTVLAFDPSAAGSSLTAVREWNLTDEFPELKTGSKTEANLGFEGLTFLPDAYLVGNGFVDQSTGTLYDPADYPLHGTGLFLTALENDGKLYAYALNSDGTFHRVAVVDTGMGHVMDVQYDTGLQRVWALCDNTCDVTSTVLGIDGHGFFAPAAVYARPAGLPAVNVEGFAVASASTCAAGIRQVVWSDDGISAAGHQGHALYGGTLPCSLDLGAQGVAEWTQHGSYAAGDVVRADGALWTADRAVKGQKPGVPNGVWLRTTFAPDGTATTTTTLPPGQAKKR